MNYEKRGYLTANFKFFHINDICDKEFEYHYHEFDKIVIMRSGSVKYIVEGDTYELKPWDTVLVGHNEIHKPVISPFREYDRYIIYIEPRYISRQRGDTQQLSACFDEAAKGRRVVNISSERFRGVLEALDEAVGEKAYASKLYSSALFVQLMVLVNRAVFSENVPEKADNGVVARVVRHINEHMTQDMSIDALAKEFYISRYHLMHIFKNSMGEPIHSYVRKKRLLRAAELLLQGDGVISVCERCGFNEYSTFSRAFKSFYGCSPTDFVHSADITVDDVFDY